MLHRQTLAYRNLSEELQTVFQLTMTKAVHREVDFLESYATIWRQNTRRSYTTVKHSGCLVPEASQRIGTESVLSDSNENNDASLFYIEDFIQKVAYVVDILKSKELLGINRFKILYIKNMNKDCKVTALMKELKLWKINTERNIFYMFPAF